MLLQLIINAISAACVYLLIALGFNLIYYTARFLNFSHAAVFVAGAYSVYFLSSEAGFSLFFSILLGILLAALLGSLLEIFIFRTLRHKRSSPLILLLASFGIYIVLQNIISIIFGDATRSLSNGNIKKGLLVFGARITFIQIIIIIISIVLLVSVWAFMKQTKTGLAMRAVADNKELAHIVGINNDRLILWAFIIGSALAGIAGILFSLDVNMTPTMGMNALMMGIIAVIVGGVGSIQGIAFGALLLGMAQHLGVWKISSQWQNAIAFFILLAFLLIKPEGFLGKKIRKAMI
ncbi:branched-chain amino acid ABC transporter permease [Acidobacteriota bacterium]